MFENIPHRNSVCELQFKTKNIIIYLPYEQCCRRQANFCSFKVPVVLQFHLMTTQARTTIVLEKVFLWHKVPQKFHVMPKFKIWKKFHRSARLLMNRRSKHNFEYLVQHTREYYSVHEAVEKSFKNLYNYDK